MAKNNNLPSRWKQLPKEIEEAFKENYYPSHSTWEGLKYVLEDMYEDLVKRSERPDVYDSPGHYEQRIHYEGQRYMIRKILNLFPTEQEK